MFAELMKGLGTFATSGPGQTIIGAGLGYGMDRLSGGDGGTGAALGGLAGAGNSLFSGGDFFKGDSFTGSFADTATSGIGNMFGSTKDTNKFLNSSGGVSVDAANARNIINGSSQVGDSLFGATTAADSASSTSSGLGDILGSSGKGSNPYVDAAGLYLSYDDNQSKNDLAQQEIDATNIANAFNQNQIIASDAAKATASAVSSGAFDNSLLNKKKKTTTTTEV